MILPFPPQHGDELREALVGLVRGVADALLVLGLLLGVGDAFLCDRSGVPGAMRGRGGLAFAVTTWISSQGRGEQPPGRDEDAQVAGLGDRPGMLRILGGILVAAVTTVGNGGEV